MASKSETCRWAPPSDNPDRTTSKTYLLLHRSAGPSGMFREIVVKERKEAGIVRGRSCSQQSKAKTQIRAKVHHPENTLF